MNEHVQVACGMTHVAVMLHEDGEVWCCSAGACSKFPSDRAWWMIMSHTDAFLTAVMGSSPYTLSAAAAQARGFRV
jgi:hypothetical protein